MDDMSFWLLIVIFIVPIFFRKKILRKYQGKIKTLPSVLHSFFVVILLCFIMAMLAGFTYGEGFGERVQNIMSALLGLVIFGGILALYVFLRSRKFTTMFPEVPGVRVVFDQIVLGWGSFTYVMLCCTFFFLMFAGVNLFDFGYETLDSD